MMKKDWSFSEGLLQLIRDGGVHVSASLAEQVAELAKSVSQMSQSIAEAYLT